jgi:hypothetical protein
MKCDCGKKATIIVPFVSYKWGTTFTNLCEECHKKHLKRLEEEIKKMKEGKR